jgi:type II secretory pathway component GspD/PulD (secretin)
MKTRILFVILCAMLLSPVINAQPTTAPAERAADVALVTRVYDVSDLIWRVNDYPAPASADFATGGGGGGQNLWGGAAGGGPDPNAGRIEQVDTFLKLVQDTIDPTSWRNNGGNLGAIRELSGNLVVTQTDENHRALASLLKQLRETHGRMVVVRAYWLLVEPDAVPKLDPGKKALPIIDDKLIDAKNLYCGAQTTCFNGQTVHVTSGRKRTMVTGLSPVVGTNAVGYQPTLENARSGVVLQLTPHLEPEGEDHLILDLQSNLTELGDVPSGKIELPATTQPSDASNAIDRVNEVSQELRTTVRLPLNKKVLVGGMTLEPAARQEGSRQLYLVVEADAVK